MSVPYIRAGSEVIFRYTVYNQRVEPPVLANPAQGVKITLTDPNGVDVVSLGVMTNEATGVYTYAVQTTTVAADWPLGTYLVSFKVQDGASIHLDIVVEAFFLTTKRIT